MLIVQVSLWRCRSLPLWGRNDSEHHNTDRPNDTNLDDKRLQTLCIFDNQKNIIIIVIIILIMIIIVIIMFIFIFITIGFIDLTIIWYGWTIL